MDMDFLSPATVNPTLKAKGETAMNASLAKGMPHGYEVGYQHFTINGRMPGHSFQVVALDGNPVPTPTDVPVLWIGTAERLSAIVKMDRSGVWVMGDLADDDRGHCMGVVVEYAGAMGKPQWIAPGPSLWDYTQFGDPKVKTLPPDDAIEMTFAKANAALGGFNQWTINGVAFSDKAMQPMFHLRQGRRYRLHMKNASDDTIR